MYLASFVINHYSESSKQAYEAAAKEFSEPLANLMNEIEVVDSLAVAANMLKKVMIYHAGTTDLHSSEGEMIVMKMAEEFEA